MKCRQVKQSEVPYRRSGFTLVELLVVITIIGILVSLLLPAVQAAREAGRQMQCKNNLRQVALACLGHEQVQHFLPTGGWGISWAGEPTRGFDKRQPGGWIYAILPYMELQSLHDLGIDQGINTKSPSINRPAFVTRVSTPITTLTCPSRRTPIAFPTPAWVPDPKWGGAMYYLNLPSQPKLVGRSDYVASGGDTSYSAISPTGWPPSLFAGDYMTEAGWEGNNGAYAAGGGSPGYYTTGIVYMRSMVKMSDITDGTSNTYLAGEKYIVPDHYTDGESPTDNIAWDIGWACDTIRWSGRMQSHSRSDLGYASADLLPAQDAPGLDTYMNFGSPHSVGCNMAFCDGSVKAVGFSIDPEIHHRLGNRQDGQVIDAKTF